MRHWESRTRARFTAQRFTANRQATIQHHARSPLTESEFRCVRNLKNSLSNFPREAREFGDLPKTCHLLPSTAILEPQNRYARCNRFIPTLAPRAYASPPGPWAERCRDVTQCTTFLKRVGAHSCFLGFPQSGPLHSRLKTKPAAAQARFSPSGSSVDPGDGLEMIADFRRGLTCLIDTQVARMNACAGVSL